LSLVERLLPLLRFIAPAVRKLPVDRDTPVLLRSTLNSVGNGLPAERSAQYVIDDLDAQASSLSTIQAAVTSAEVLVVQCPLVRLDIRCPAPLNRRGSWGSGAHLRSGIVTLDIHGLLSRIGSAGGGKQLQPSGPMRRSSQTKGGMASGEDAASIEVEWQKMILFFCRVPGGLSHVEISIKLTIG
jgi:autophagy-related protein 2